MDVIICGSSVIAFVVFLLGMGRGKLGEAAGLAVGAFVFFFVIMSCIRIAAWLNGAIPAV